MRGSATPRSITALAALLLGATGCTICPDPFDYTGPVPDGSAPQNDFRARANGISPLGSHPVPWPPVVQSAPRPADDSGPTIAAAKPAAAEPADDDGHDAGPMDEPVDVRPVLAETPVAAAVDPPRPVEEIPNVIAAPDEPVVEAILPPARPRPRIEPPLRETPGWKPRG